MHYCMQNLFCKMKNWNNTEYNCMLLFSKNRSKGENLDYVKSYQPRKKGVHLRILLHGPVGAGKSSFINSVDSILQGRITGRALTDHGTTGSSFTKSVWITDFYCPSFLSCCVAHCSCTFVFLLLLTKWARLEEQCKAGLM